MGKVSDRFAEKAKYNNRIKNLHRSLACLTQAIEEECSTELREKIGEKFFELMELDPDKIK